MNCKVPETPRCRERSKPGTAEYTKGDIKTIQNHKMIDNVAMIIDWWEHAWALDYQHDKAKYLKNIWKIINWDIVNERINGNSQ